MMLKQMPAQVAAPLNNPKNNTALIAEHHDSQIAGAPCPDTSRGSHPPRSRQPTEPALAHADLYLGHPAPEPEVAFYSNPRIPGRVQVALSLLHYGPETKTYAQAWTKEGRSAREVKLFLNRLVARLPCRQS
jgi:hypothetical protein